MEVDMGKVWDVLLILVLLACVPLVAWVGAAVTEAKGDCDAL